MDANADCVIRERTTIVMDDDAATLRLIDLILVEAGYRVVAARNGREGLAYVAAVQPDVIVLDLMMPVMDGWQVLERLSRTSDVPVVVLTARGDVKSQERCHALGAVDYIVKPVAARDFTDRVARAAQGRQASGPRQS